MNPEQLATTEKAIEETLKKYPKARRVPVENVAFWGNDQMANSMNLEMDRAAYNWTGDTYKAILHVLKIQGKI